MAIPVGPTTATFMVSIAALGGCGYWWQCGPSRETKSTYEFPKVSAEIDHHPDFLSDEVDLDGASFARVVDQPSFENPGLDTQANQHQDTISEEAHLVEVTLEGDVEQSSSDNTNPDMRKDQHLESISEETHLAGATLEGDAEQSSFVFHETDMQKDQHLETISEEAHPAGETLEGDVEQSFSEISDFNTWENHSEESDAATEVPPEMLSETGYHAEDVLLEENVVIMAQEDHSGETDETLEVHSETPSELDRHADIQSEENTSTPEIAPAQNTLMMDGSLLIGLLDAEPSSVEEPIASTPEHSELNFEASPPYEKAKHETETVKHPVSVRMFGATESITQTLGLVLPMGFGFALLCDAVILLALMRFIVQMRKWLGGTSKAALPHIAVDLPIAATFAEPKFCKAKQPLLDEPIEDSFEETTSKIDPELQTQINLIVQSHAEFRKLQQECHVEAVAQEALHAAKERRLSLSASKQDPPWSSPKELASPSPAKSLSNIELNYIAHMSLSAAKERNTPAKSPYAFCDIAPCSIQWDAYEEGMQSAPSISRNLQSRFDDDDEDHADNNVEQEIPAKSEHVEQSASLAMKKNVDQAEQDVSLDAKESKHEDEEPAFDVTQIPSPCRRRARAALAKSEDLGLGGQAPKAKEETSEHEKCTVADTPSDVAQHVNWKSQDNQLQASPGTHTKPKTTRKTQYQSSPHSWQRQQAWTTVTNAAASEKGLTPSRELANRRAKAFEAWGVASPDQYDFSFQ